MPTAVAPERVTVRRNRRGGSGRVRKQDARPAAAKRVTDGRGDGAGRSRREQGTAPGRPPHSAVQSRLFVSRRAHADVRQPISAILRKHAQLGRPRCSRRQAFRQGLTKNPPACQKIVPENARLPVRIS